ncbi:MULTISPECIES: hypothetical protein [unclassified Roseitalea]|uniref:hypothetical protein n=1 Tax=unclassified Roseitalea TaxID=2639107 RepID=UPI00273F98C1|nr:MULTISPECIES: hypothetical protein [unclassified Roseitalea]
MITRIGLALLLFGAAGALAYPVWFGTYYNIDLGTYRVYDRQDGFQAITDIALSPAAAPLDVVLTGRSDGPPPADDAVTTITLVINDADGTLAAEVIDLVPRPDDLDPDPAAGARLYAELPPVAPVGTGGHDFIFGEGGRSEIPLAFVDMTLTAAVAEPAPRIAPASYALMGVGLLLIVASRRRGRRPRAPAGASGRSDDGRVETSNIGRRVPLDRAPDKPKRRWGRGGGD